MSIRYIKNCTGGDSEQKKVFGKKSAISKTISRAIFYILFACFLGVATYVLFFAEYLKISNIKISGTKELRSEDIQAVIESAAEGKYLQAVPKNNFLFFPEMRIANLLKDNFKKIRSASVTRKFPNSIAINIDERKAVLVWCSSENCFLVDEDGTAYSNADFDSQEIVQNNLIRINDLSGHNFSIGEKIIDSDFEQYALDIKEALKNVGFKISEDNDAYATPSSMADEIDVKTKEGTNFLFSTQFPLEEAMRTLNVALKKGVDDKQKDFEYIDLRSEGKVFYKLKNEEEKKEEKQTETSNQ